MFVFHARHRSLLSEVSSPYVLREAGTMRLWKEKKQLLVGAAGSINSFSMEEFPRTLTLRASVEFKE